MVRITHLRKTYDKITAVDDLSLEVKGGEIYGLLGPNGAGKTTTVSIVSGLLKATSGTVFLDGKDLSSEPRLAKKVLGVVPQDLALYEELSARENLMFWGSLFHLPRSELKANIEVWLERVGLKGREREAVSKFSGGMKRRLNLAIGLVHNPKVALLDEPTVGIDPQARKNILDIIREIVKEGSTILFTTHHLEEAEALCDRIAIIDHGKILETGSVEELAKVVGDGDIVSINGSFTAVQLKTILEDESVNILSAAEHTATMSLSHGGMNIAALLQKFSQAGIEVTDISMQKPSLESVFLKLTGRELRD